MSPKLETTDERQSALHLVSVAWIELIKSASLMSDDHDSGTEAAVEDSSRCYLTALKKYKVAVRTYWANQPRHVVDWQRSALPRDEIPRILYLSKVRCSGRYREGDRMNLLLFREQFDLLVKILGSMRLFWGDTVARSFFAAQVTSLEAIAICPEPVDP